MDDSPIDPQQPYASPTQADSRKGAAVIAMPASVTAMIAHHLELIRTISSARIVAPRTAAREPIAGTVGVHSGIVAPGAGWVSR